jgi:hypothetical protein
MPHEQDLVLVHKAIGEPKAQLIKSLLEDFGIPVSLESHVPPAVLPMTFDGLSEIRILVLPEHREQAQEIIRDYFEEPVTD